MKPEQLVEQLAQDLRPVKPVGSSSGWVAGFLGLSIVAVSGWLAVFHTRADLGAKMGMPEYWIELVLPVFLAAIALLRVNSLSIPGRAAGKESRILWILVAVLTVFELLRSGDLAIGMDIAGLRCFALVMLFSLIQGMALAFAVSRRAPSRLGETGINISFAALAAGFVGIAFHCPVDNSVHISLWHYVLPLMVGGAAGFFILGRALRW